MQHESLKSLTLGLTIIHISDIPPEKERGKGYLFLVGSNLASQLLVSQMGI
jgi:hypothetical protein